MTQKTPTGIVVKLIEILGEKGGGSDAKCALNVGELRELLAGLPEDDLKQEKNLRDYILERLGAYVERNPEGDGITAADLWREIRAEFPETKLNEIEDTLTELIRANEIHTRHNAFTTYLPGADEELQAGRGEA